jgi:hypothetical protein
MWVASHTQRTMTTLQGICRLTLCVRRCRNQQCEWYHRPYRPEEEGRWALPHSDGQHSIRNAVQTVLPDVPHQLCHFHYLREAAKPMYEADRHAKKELKKHLRGVRPIERAVEKRSDAEAEAIRGYCLAIRSALLG